MSQSGEHEFDSAPQVARWRVERATRELDSMVNDVYTRREAVAVRAEGPAVGALDARRDRRLNRTDMLGEILTPAVDELTRAREQGDHTLLEQAHATARLTDRMPQPLHRATNSVRTELAVNEQQEQRLSRRLQALNQAAVEAKTSPQQRLSQARRLTKERVDTRKELDAVRAIQRDLHATQAAVTERTKQLRNLDIHHHRALSRGVAALTVLGERGHPTELGVHGVLDTETGKVRLGPWDTIIARPSRAEEAPYTLGGANTGAALAGENARDEHGRPDLTRRQQAIRDRGQLAELTRQLDPTPVSARTRQTTTRQQPSRGHRGNRARGGRGGVSR